MRFPIPTGDAFVAIDAFPVRSTIARISQIVVFFAAHSHLRNIFMNTDFVVRLSDRKEIAFERPPYLSI